MSTFLPLMIAVLTFLGGHHSTPANCELEQFEDGSRVETCIAEPYICITIWDAEQPNKVNTLTCDLK